MAHNTIAQKKIDFARNSDSFFTHLFARSLSIHITPLLANTEITPLQVTITGLALGLAGAAIGSIPSWYSGIFAALLIESAHVLDCVDGELARLTGRGNPFAAAMDPITDRVKDTSVIFAAYLNSVHSKVFELQMLHLSAIAIWVIGIWFLYMYIVDAYLNPARKLKSAIFFNPQKRIYFGLNDLFIYGSILFLILDIFDYFLFYTLSISLFGIPFQLFQLRKCLISS